MVETYAFPKAPFSGVTEDDLHNARQRCERLLFKCYWSHLVFSNLLDDADPQRVVTLPGGLDTIAKRWCETLDAIHEFWPPFRRNNVGLVIERANANHDMRVKVTMGLVCRTFPTAHAAIERIGQSALGMNRTDVPTTKQSLSLPTGRENLREALAAYPQIGNELFESLKSALVMEWSNACEWLSKQKATPQFIPTPLQSRILSALKGRRLTKERLAGEVAGGDASRLYVSRGKRKGDLNELMDLGKVINQNPGYVSTEFPPEE